MSARHGARRVEIVLVYQSLLGIYGDRGNADVLLRRLAWRGFDAVLTLVEGDAPLPATGDVFLLGGSEDAAQAVAVRALRADGGLHRAVERGAVVFAVCAGFQLMGNSFTLGAEDETVEGLGLLDVTTTRGSTRAVGEVLAKREGVEGDEAWLSGFENHGGRTTLGPAAQPLARVEVGFGNCGDGTEGAVAGHVIGTYCQGPALARNPALADAVLELALGSKLEPLYRPEIDELRRQRLYAARHGS